MGPHGTRGAQRMALSRWKAATHCTAGRTTMTLPFGASNIHGQTSTTLQKGSRHTEICERRSAAMLISRKPRNSAPGTMDQRLTQKRRCCPRVFSNRWCTVCDITVQERAVALAHDDAVPLETVFEAMIEGEVLQVPGGQIIDATPPPKPSWD